jgi:FKBP-type peptidyl-prolyl cis-trans isomerase
MAMEKSTALKIGGVLLLLGLYGMSRVVSEPPVEPMEGDDHDHDAPTTQTTSAPGANAPHGGPVVPNATKLQITDIKVGSGVVATEGKNVSVNYRGTLTNGTVFDESYKRGQPFDFRLGAGEVIKGWDEGVKGMKVGGRRKLIIPPALAYGSEDKGTIPPNSTLIFEVELLKVS